MPDPFRNRQEPWVLTEDDVQAALARIAGRDEEFAQQAEHVYGTLTWGGGPGRMRQAATGGFACGISTTANMWRQV